MLQFDRSSTALEVANALGSRITNKTVLITGTSPDGLGAYAAHAIASANPSLLILATRNPELNAATEKWIHESYPSVAIRLHHLDLSSFANVRRSAAELIADSTLSIDVLINNGGIAFVPYSLTADGIESSFAINHLGHFLFTNQLLAHGKLRRPGARIINVTSGAYLMHDVLLDDYNFQHQPYNKWISYASSKTAAILFARALNRKLLASSVSAAAVHPGAIFTHLGRHMTSEDMALMLSLQMEISSKEQGAAGLVAAAFSLEDEGEGDQPAGIYWSECQPGETDQTAAPWAHGEDHEERLWKISEELVGEVFQHSGVEPPELVS